MVERVGQSLREHPSNGPCATGLSNSRVKEGLWPWLMHYHDNLWFAGYPVPESDDTPRFQDVPLSPEYDKSGCRDCHCRLSGVYKGEFRVWTHERLG